MQYNFIKLWGFVVYVFSMLQASHNCPIELSNFIANLAYSCRIYDDSQKKIKLLFLILKSLVLGKACLGDLCIKYQYQIPDIFEKHFICFCIARVLK